MAFFYGECKIKCCLEGQASILGLPRTADMSKLLLWVLVA